MYVYKQTEPSLWTVGYYDPTGKWMPESDHATEGQASGRVIQLNGGGKNQDTENVAELRRIIDVAVTAHYNRGVRAAAMIVQTVIGQLSEKEFEQHRRVLEIVYDGITKLKEV